jgi:hypothetical protein
MGFVIVPAQPFGFNYLGGKLLAAICTTHEVRRMLDEKYGMTTCLFETTSLYGSSKAVSQYDGMKPLIRFKGLTDSDFLPMLHGDTYTNLKDYIEGIIEEPLAPEGASSRKLKISNAMVSIIKTTLKGTPEGEKFAKTIENAKNLNEQKRYFISDYGFKNMIEFVNGDTETAPPTRVLRPAGALNTPRDASVPRYRPTTAPPGFATVVTFGVVVAGSFITIRG